MLTITRITEYTTDALLSVTNNKYVILLFCNVSLLVVGCFLETIASISILVPVLMPVILKVGIDPVHFGVVMTLNLMIGLLHPPLGMGCSCSRASPSCHWSGPPRQFCRG